MLGFFVGRRYLWLFVIVCALAAFLGCLLWRDHAYEMKDLSTETPHYKTPQEADPYVRFDMEAYDTILSNYWQKASESDLAGLFQLSVQKALSTTTVMTAKDRASTAAMLSAAFGNASTSTKHDYAVNTLIVALYNLAPAGRSQLLSQQQVTALRQEVSNINPNTDLYGNLGLQKGASTDDVEKAYAQKSAELAKATSTEAKEELKQVSYAHEVLTKPDDKGRYDSSQVEPTVFAHVLGAHTLYLDIKQISPTTLDEFVNTANDEVSKDPQLTGLVLDLRGNIGGALAIAQYFLGLFIGQNQYAFDFFHQGDYQAQRTLAPQIPSVTHFKEVAVLTDGMTQSTAEIITAAMKRFHLATVVGTPTRGWGTIENTYPINTTLNDNTTYAMLLVNSLTLRDDNQPVEGKGVDPNVNTTAADWKSQVAAAVQSVDLRNAIDSVATKPPLR